MKDRNNIKHEENEEEHVIHRFTGVHKGKIRDYMDNLRKKISGR